MSRNAYTSCDEPGCDRSPAKGDVLHRVNPKGQLGIFKCPEHAKAPAPAFVLDCTDCGQMFMFATWDERQAEFERTHSGHEVDMFRQARV